MLSRVALVLIPLILLACDRTPPPPVADTGAAPEPLSMQDTPPAVVDTSVLTPPEQGGVRALHTSRDKADFAFGKTLAEVVTAEGLVRYELLEDRTQMAYLSLAVDEYTQAVQHQEPKDLLAMLCNGYNANVMFHAFIARSVESFTNVLEVEGFFDERPIVVGMETLTLNVLENERIRPMGDPRIHAALVCAAMSCPVLTREIYRADTIDAQLDAQCRRWVNDTTRNRVANGVLQLSEIFKWYADDFTVEPYGSVTGFLKTFADPDSELGKFLATNENPTIEWITYDWSLNEAR